MYTKPRLLDLVREVIRRKHYSIRTEECYVDWIRRFILFHKKKHPSEMGQAEVEAFLSHLAVEGKVSASTQNQAKSAILFLYKQVLGIELPWLDGVTNAKASQRLPLVLTVEEVTKMLSLCEGTTGLMLKLIYGTGMRLMECMRLRVKDIEFTRNEIVIREGKGAKDRVSMLPAALHEPLRQHLKRVRQLHIADLEEGIGSVPPFACEVPWMARAHGFPALAGNDGGC